MERVWLLLCVRRPCTKIVKKAVVVGWYGIGEPSILTKELGLP